MLELGYEMIFVDKDIVSIASVVIFCFLVIVIVIGVTGPKRKAKKGILDFKVNFATLDVLDQEVMLTDNKFYVSNGNGAQDKLFKEKYEVGMKIDSDLDETFLISRIKRQPRYNGLNITFAYIIYFEKFEYCEFPKDIVIKSNKNVDYIKFDKEGIKLIKEENFVYDRVWSSCNFSNLNFKINFTDDGIKNLFSLSEKNFENKDDYHFVEEILIKYAHNIVNNKLD